MYEITIEIIQNVNNEKYNVGIPKMTPSKLKIRTKGILKTNNNAIDNTTSFCS